MTQVELAITILMEDTDVERMRKAFGRRMKNANVTIDVVLNLLKRSAIQQIGNVILEEERAAFDEQKAALTPPSMS